MPERPAESRSLAAGFAAVLKDLWQLIKQRAGLLAFILCFLPLGTGAAPFAAIAGEWRASANTVALITGVLGGVISAVGCLVGGWLCDRMNRQGAYVCFGLGQSAACVAMALFPHNQPMFILWASIYTFTSGLAYAAFSAFVLEAIGHGAAATKYTALAALSNVPIYYLTNLDGWANDRWNSNKMFYLEAALGVAASLFFIILAKCLLRPKFPARPVGA
jgi:predicted MFS family arabinose efflux permease